jgi:O-antigen/teichoic acid export membrane protein
MHSLFSELRKIRGELLAIVHSPSRINTILKIPFYSNALYLMLANVTNALFGFGFWIIVAHRYSPDAVGIATAVLSSAGLLELLCGLGLSYGILSFLFTSNTPIKLINASFTLTGLLSLAAAAIFIIGLGLWSPGLKILREDPYYAVIFMLYVPVLVLDDLTDQVMTARRQANLVFIHLLIFNIMRMALPLLLVLFFQSFGIFGSWSAATLIALIISVFLLLPSAQPGYRPFFILDKTVLSKVLRFSFLNYMGDLFWNLPVLILPIIIINLLGAKSNAYFFIAWAISGILTMIPLSVGTSLLAEGASDESQLKNNIQRSLKMVLLLLVPAVILVWFLANKILLLYGGVYAENSASLLRWLSITSLPLTVNIIYFSIKRVQRKMKPVILMTVFMAIIVILISFLLLPRLGINGVGIAWLAGQSMITFIAITWDMRRWIKR